MSISQFLTKLDELHVYIEVVDDKLKIQAPEGKLTPALINELKEKKQEIIEFFQKNIPQKKYISITPTVEKDYYELSSPQMRMYLLQQMNLNNTVYNITEFIKLDSTSIINNKADSGIDVKKLEDTFKRLIERHESLRTSFHMVKETPTQKIHKEVDFKIEFFNKADDFIRPFDLTQAPLIRVGIIETESEDRLLGIDMHHIICDGTSHEILAKDFYSLYRNESQLPALRIHYKDYTEWQNSQKQREASKNQEAYWLKEFSGEIPIIDIPTDFTRPAIQSFEGHKLFFEITGETALMLTNMALENGTTLYIILLSILNILWAKLSGQEDIIMGTPTAGRRHADLEGIIGMFVNTLVLRNYPCGAKTFKAFLQEVNQRTLEAFENQDYQFEDLVEKLVITRDFARNPLFDMMFAWQDINSNVNSEASFPGVSHYTKPLSRFDITWAGVGNKYRLFFAIEYCTKIFKEGTILKFIEFFKKIISSIIGRPGSKIAQIEIITEEEKKQILVYFNDTEKAYPKEMTIHRLFEEQVSKISDNIAVIAPSKASGIQLSYRELNERSERLAAWLKGKRLESDTIVGIMAERSIEMIIGIIAILKAGGAYLPIDPDYPWERINFMLKDSGAKLLVTTNDKEVEKVRSWEGEQIFLEFITHHSNQLSIHHSSFDIPRIHHSSHLAYVIYTSGTSGRPKGVMIEHISVVNLLFAMQCTYPFMQTDAYLLKTSYVFDVSVTELFGWYLGGGKLVILEREGEKDPGTILASIEKNSITHVNFVPSMFNAFIEHITGENRKRLASLKYIFLAGEVLLPIWVEKFRNLGTTILLKNIYGPTESTIYASQYSLAEWDGFGSIPIGKPLPNLNIYILDSNGSIQPINIVGELCISGIGLARGYLNRPELTAEKFVSHPLVPGEKMYRSGDQARWLQDGNIEFLGRIDQQVKIRGFRIELGEIEMCLSGHHEIKEAVVICREDATGNKYLCAYIVRNDEIAAELNSSELREYLSQTLPGYMIPTYFMPIDKIPLTHNGKIDHKALPEPEIKTSKDYVPPESETEKKLAEIWSQVLGVEKDVIGKDSNFFEMGGNSFNLINLMGKLYKEYEIDIPFAQIIEFPRLMDMANFITTKNFFNQPAFLLNWKKKKKIFGFPDQFGFGIGYTSLGFLLKDYSLYSLTFIEDEDRINQYIDLITGIQPTGPYVFLGHSSAGKLSFVITAALEKLGFEVSDIIFADCFFVENMAVGANEEYYKQLSEVTLNTLKLHNAEYFFEKALAKGINYTKFRDNIPILEKVNANVHLILSQEAQQKISDISDPHCWDKLTSRRAQIYNGWGDHRLMLYGSDLEKNIKIIKKILNEIGFGK